MDPDLAQDVLASWDGRKVTLKSAKPVLRAWARAKGWSEDRYGNFKISDNERYHFSKQRIQRQRKSYGRWANVRSTPMIDGAMNVLLASAKALGDDKALAKLEGRKAKRRSQKEARREKEREEREAQDIQRIAYKMLGSEEPVELAEGVGRGYLAPRAKGLFDKHVEQLTALKRLGGKLPTDQQLFSVEEPPFTPIVLDVGEVSWEEEHDGVDYTVSVDKTRTMSNTAVVEIGAAPGIGQRIDPITGATRMDVHGMNRQGDAYISGYIRRTDDGALGVLFIIVAKEKRRGAGGRVLDLWCELMEAYGSAVWHARAVGDEGQAFLDRKVDDGQLEYLGKAGPDEVYRCCRGRGDAF
jgi:hypothetical protein